MIPDSSKPVIPQWPFKENSLFDKLAVWIEKTFFGSSYNPTPEKLMVVALCTNIFGLHRVYAGRKIGAVVGWLLLLFSLVAREYMLWLLLPWLVIELIRIALGNYGRVKTNQKIDFNNFRELLLSKTSGAYKAIFAGVSVLTLVMILAFAPRTDLNAESAMVSGSDAVSGSEITISATDTTTATTSKKTKATEKTTTKKTTEATTTTTSSKKTKNILMDAQIRECPVMNGTKTERIGTYAYIITDKELLKKTCSEADYIEFLNKRVKDSGYNWFTIVFEDNTGIQYGGSYIYQGTYGKLDKDRCITKAIGDVFLEDGKVTYEKR